MVTHFLNCYWEIVKQLSWSGTGWMLTCTRTVFTKLSTGNKDASLAITLGTRCTHWADYFRCHCLPGNINTSWCLCSTPASAKFCHSQASIQKLSPTPPFFPWWRGMCLGYFFTKTDHLFLCSSVLVFSFLFLFFLHVYSLFILLLLQRWLCYSPLLACLYLWLLRQQVCCSFFVSHPTPHFLAWMLHQSWFCFCLCALYLCPTIIDFHEYDDLVNGYSLADPTFVIF